jgi:hypothetical protein
VSTTGATLNACARPLLDAGAAEVRAVTAAKTLAAGRWAMGDERCAMSDARCAMTG